MNSLEISFRAKGTPDNRYRCLVSLIRADRPRYWNFLCVNCGKKVVELQNYEVIGLTDFYDARDLNNNGVGRSCKTFDKESGGCPYIYFFNLN